MARLKHFLSVMNMGVQLGAPQGPCRHTRLSVGAGAGVLLLGNSLQISFNFRGECIYFGRIGSIDAD
jgi:hypothetical protein